MQFGTASCTAACSRRTRNGPLLMIIGVDFHPSLASSRSVFRFLTRWASISAGSAIHNSKSSSANNRSNQRDLHSYLHVDSFSVQVPIESLCFSTLVVQSLAVEA